MAGRGEQSDERAYDPAAFPPFAVTADLAVFTLRDGSLCLLLVRRGVEPFAGCWALPGGFVQPHESADEAARRELAEETGVEFAGHLEQLATYSDPDRDPRMRVVSVAYVALAPSLPDVAGGSDAAEARWWPVTSMRPAELAFDHAHIVGDALERVRAKLEYTTLATQFVDEPFTVRDLQEVYEAVWGVTWDRANFRRKVLSTPGFVVSVEHGVRPGSATGGRSAQLYRRGDALALYPPILRPK
ncbi:NUDIX hydrolase [Jiangella anatolica]|uniref:NUDIX hydrolase n=1 Tax=Jiangella anatolica TaxID=2670374 RepID=A0A2W2BUU9_9ACTN|nr:NUDIX hydrolase [Jiangella anatolica]PZF83748.1 NUDIX hydrolase [Jiangella anatolica]